MTEPDPPADVDPAEFPDAATIQCDAIPELVDDAATPTGIIERNTGRHRISQVEFATAVELTDRDAYARGVEHGRKLERAQAEADAVHELRKVREDVVETVRALFVIFEIPHPDWAAAEEWIRRRLTPL